MATSSNDVEVFFKDLEEEFRLAKDLLTLLKMKEVRDDIRSLRPFATLRDEIGPLRSVFKEYMNKMYNVALPLILVYCVSSLENFLRLVWEAKIGPIPKNLRRIFSDPKEFSKVLKNRLGVEIGSLAIRANAVAEKRHIIIHNKGIVDKKALCAFKEASINGLQEGQRLQLTVEDVGEDIKILEEFAVFVKKAFFDIKS